MRQNIKFLTLSLILILFISGCNKDAKKETTPTPTADSLIEEKEMFTENDLDDTYDASKSVSITLNGDSASCDSDAVLISGTTITIQEEGTYIFSGTLNNGMIYVNAGEKAKPRIVLNGASITNATSTALYVLEADKVFVTLAKGSTNTLSNGGVFNAIDDNNIDGAVFSKQDLTFNGSGSLTVTSPIGHGIVCKDDLVFAGGTYHVTSASHGLDANDSVRITNTSLTIDSGKDGVHAENTDDTSLGFVYVKDGTYNISAEGDGLSASANMQIDDGTFEIVTGGGSVNATKQTSDSWGGFMGGGRPGRVPQSQQPQQPQESSTDSTSIKGVKATSGLLIKTGTFTIDSADDSVHSNASLTVNGGTFKISAGDDAFHADETLTILAGTIDISTSYEGLEGLHIVVSGGDIKLVASDDGLNAAGGTDSSGMGGPRRGDMFGKGAGGMGGSGSGSITISGGTLYVNASGDGLDANGTLAISGGHTTVVGPTRGDTATLDYDVSATITGGTFIGTGASGMAQTFSSSEQGMIAVNVGNQEAETSISIKDEEGKTLLSYKPELSFAVVIFSNPDLKTGDSYTIEVGTASKTLTAQ